MDVSAPDIEAGVLVKDEIGVLVRRIEKPPAALHVFRSR